MDCHALIAAELATWPSKDQMAALLREAGLRVTVGRYSVRVEDCSSFTFEEYGGDLGDPQVVADAATVDEMLRDGRLVSDVLARAGLRHRFEVYDDERVLRGYLHFNWPLPEYEGVYVAHWEVARFAVVQGRFLGWLWRRVEKWAPHFPDNFELPNSAVDSPTPRGPPRFYRMRVRGQLGPR